MTMFFPLREVARLKGWPALTTLSPVAREVPVFLLDYVICKISILRPQEDRGRQEWTMGQRSESVTLASISHLKNLGEWYFGLD